MKQLTLLLSVILCAPLVSCSSSTQPSSSAAVSVTAPRGVSPVASTQFKYVSQPITLVVTNAAKTGTSANTYTFEVATDPLFGSKVYTKSGVAEGAGQTSLKIDTLPGSTDYYWHVRAESGGAAGPFTAAQKFTVGPPIVVNAPTVVSPTGGAAQTGRPVLTVINASKSGPAGAVSYKFEFATNSAFTGAQSVTVSEGSGGQTTYQPYVQFAAGKTFFWRVTATDQANAISSPPSSVGTFVTSLSVDLHTAISVRGPDVADWPQTAIVLSVEQDGSVSSNGAMCISWTPNDDWPSVPFFGEPLVPVWANQWYMANIGGQWYAGAGEWLRSDRGFCKSGQGTNTIGPEGGWNAPMNGWVPRVGELVGYFITTPARQWPSMRTTDERSDVILQPWRDTSLGSTAVGRTK